MSVSGYNITHTPQIEGLGRPVYACTMVGNGVPAIEISDMGLSSMHEGVPPFIMRFINVDSQLAFGHTGTEAGAEAYGQRMLGQFIRKAG